MVYGLEQAMLSNCWEFIQAMRALSRLQPFSLTYVRLWEPAVSRPCYWNRYLAVLCPTEIPGIFGSLLIKSSDRAAVLRYTGVLWPLAGSSRPIF